MSNRTDTTAPADTGTADAADGPTPADAPGDPAPTATPAGVPGDPTPAAAPRVAPPLLSPALDADAPGTTGTARRWPRRLAIAFAAIVTAAFVAVAAFLVYASDYYRAGSEAQASLTPTAEVPVEQGARYLAFGDPAAQTGIVFYPGAKVEYLAYAPLMRNLAERGYLAVVVEMPFNFAFFDIAAADGVRAAYPQVERWWVGGHSLGGSMAAQYAADHADDAALAGLALLGAYSASDLSACDLDAVVVYGQNDQVLDRSKLEDNAPLLPEGALAVEIAGGNHAGFGDYGPQEGDGEAGIAPQEQQEQAADALASRMAQAA